MKYGIPYLKYPGRLTGSTSSFDVLGNQSQLVLCVRSQPSDSETSRFWSRNIENCLEDTRILDFGLNNPHPNGCIAVVSGSELQRYATGLNIRDGERRGSFREYCKGILLFKKRKPGLLGGLPDSNFVSSLGPSPMTVEAKMSKEYLVWELKPLIVAFFWLPSSSIVDFDSGVMSPQ